jgi:hypothetical protein
MGSYYPSQILVMVVECTWVPDLGAYVILRRNSMEYAIYGSMARNTAGVATTHRPVGHQVRLSVGLILGGASNLYVYAGAWE